MFRIHMSCALRYIARMTSWTFIDKAIGAVTGAHFLAHTRRSVGGGCINQAYVIEDAANRYFVKLNRADAGEMFVAEADGLTAILASGAIRAPSPVCWGCAGDEAYLVLEYLSFDSEHTDSERQLGAALAALHRCTGANYGWHRDNTIGATPQLNESNDDWATFWRERRLRFQLQRAAARGCGAALRRKGERLLNNIDVLLRDHTPSPALLHGDLWFGNYAVLDSGVPVIFDPAVYYGDRETDLAMTELFGGFSREFYDTYHAHYPLCDGYPRRKILYNLYHVLNHYNLFGGGYAEQAERMMDRLLSEVS